MNHKKIVLIIVLLCVSVISVFSSFTAVISDTVSSNDTLQSVTDRGATTTNQIIINNDLGIGTTPDRALHIKRTSNTANDDQVVALLENDGTANQVRLAFSIPADTSTDSRLFGGQFLATAAALTLINYEARPIRLRTGHLVGAADNGLEVTTDGGVKVNTRAKSQYAYEVLDTDGASRGGFFLGGINHALIRLYSGTSENIRLQGYADAVNWIRTTQGLIIDTHSPFGNDPSSALHIVDNIGGATGGIYVERYHNTAITATGFVMGRARGNASSPSAVQNGDRLAFFLARGRTTGSSWANGAGITFKVDETVTTTGVPTSISFETGTTGGDREDRLIMSSGSEIYMPFVYNVEVGATNRDLFIDNSGKLGYVSSSERYKKDIIEYDSTRRITDLEVKEYTRKENNVKEIGLIAEEVAVLFPELVSYKLDEHKIWTICNTEDTNYTNVPCQKTQFVQTNIPETVQYSKIGLFLIDDVQKLQSQVTALEQRILALENTKR